MKYINPPPQQKWRYVHNAARSHQNSQCGIRSCPPFQNDDILPWFLSPSFFYALMFRLLKDSFSASTSPDFETLNVNVWYTFVNVDVTFDMTLMSCQRFVFWKIRPQYIVSMSYTVYICTVPESSRFERLTESCWMSWGIWRLSWIEVKFNIIKQTSIKQCI